MVIIRRVSSYITSRPYWWAYALGIVALLLAGWLWWSKIFLNPERVFWGMIDNSLSTRAVTIETTQDTGRSKVTQLVQVELGATNRAHSLSTLTQGNTEIKTEIIGTRDTDYTRYRSIKTDQKKDNGQPLAVNKVLNLWSKSADIAQSETQTSGHQLFAQATLGIGLPIGSVPVPIGEVTPEQRAAMSKHIKDERVYDVSFKDVKKERQNGRLVYVYDVKIQTILYVRLMKDFARNLGLKELDMVDPNSYQATQPLQVRLSIDPYARRLVGVRNGQQGYSQHYKAYGLPVNVELPKDAITTTELQQRLSEL